MSRAVPSCTARGVCLMDALCWAIEYVGKQAPQPIKRTISRTRQLRLVEEENEEMFARKRLRCIGSTPGCISKTRGNPVRELGRETNFLKHTTIRCVVE